MDTLTEQPKVESKPDAYQSYTCALGEIRIAMESLIRAMRLMQPFYADNDIHALIGIAHSAAFVAHQQVCRVLGPYAYSDTIDRMEREPSNVWNPAEHGEGFPA
jgi:hypothetical protein